MPHLEPSPPMLTASAGEGRLHVTGTAQPTGDGVIIALTGGDRPHVGAVGVGIPRHSLQDAHGQSATSSVFTITGHKDDELAKPLAELFARTLGQVAVVVVGLHLDNASPAEIASLSEHARQAAGQLLSRLASARKEGA